MVVSRISPLPCRPRPPPTQDQEKLARLRRERKEAVREEVAARKELARLNNEARVLEVRSQLDAKLKDRNARRAELLRRESARIASDREARVVAAAERVATTAADRQNRARAAPTARAVPPVRPDPTRVDDDDARDARRLAFARRRRASRRDAAAADRAAARAAADARWDRVDETAAVDADERRRRRSSDASVSTTTETTDSLASDVAAEAVEEDPTETDDVTVKPGGMSWSSPARPRARAVAVDDAAAKAAEAAAVERAKVASGAWAWHSPRACRETLEVGRRADATRRRQGGSRRRRREGERVDRRVVARTKIGGDDDAVGVASTNGETRRRARLASPPVPPGAHPRGAHSRGAHPPLRARGRERGHRPRRGGSRARARGFVVAREGGRRGCRDPSRIPIRSPPPDPARGRARPASARRSRGHTYSALGTFDTDSPFSRVDDDEVESKRSAWRGEVVSALGSRGIPRATRDGEAAETKSFADASTADLNARAKDSPAGSSVVDESEAPASLTMVDVLAAAAAATSPRRVRRTKTRREKKLGKLPFAAAGAAIRGVKRAGGGLVRGVGGGLLRGGGGACCGVSGDAARTARRFASLRRVAICEGKTRVSARSLEGVSSHACARSRVRWLSRSAGWVAFSRSRSHDDAPSFLGGGLLLVGRLLRGELRLPCLIIAGGHLLLAILEEDLLPEVGLLPVLGGLVVVGLLPVLGGLVGGRRLGGHVDRAGRLSALGARELGGSLRVVSRRAAGC